MDSAANEKMITSCTMVAGSRTMENRFGSKKKQSSIPRILMPKTAPRYLFSGTEIWRRIINPTTASTRVAAVATSPRSIPKTWAKMASEPTIIASVSPAGRALVNTFLRKCPSIRLLLLSNASKNPGSPMVNILINEI